MLWNSLRKRLPPGRGQCIVLAAVPRCWVGPEWMKAKNFNPHHVKLSCRCRRRLRRRRCPRYRRALFRTSLFRIVFPPSSIQGTQTKTRRDCGDDFHPSLPRVLGGWQTRNSFGLVRSSPAVQKRSARLITPFGVIANHRANMADRQRFGTHPRNLRP